jgi:hypothetical protein
MLSIPTLKNLRKWRDRAFMARERLLDLLLLRGTKRVLIWPWAELEEPIRRGFNFTRHHVTFAAIPAGGGDFDVVVPLSNDTLIAAAADPELCARNPLPIPSPAVVNLMHDKHALNVRLRELGFGRYVPRDAGPGEFPSILKLRCDSASRNIHRLDGPEDEARLATELASPEWVRQECVLSEKEYAGHILQIDGRVRRSVHVSFWLESERAIKGRDHVRLLRRCRSRHDALFGSMLAALGFEGLCCFNYKERDGVPIVIEINPRFGFTFGPFFAVFMRSLDWQKTRNRSRV